jgi:hypothetical protein
MGQWCDPPIENEVKNGLIYWHRDSKFGKKNAVIQCHEKCTHVIPNLHEV